MNRLNFVIFLILCICYSIRASAEPTYSIAYGGEENLKTILRYVDPMPEKSIQSKFQWLVIISWKYLGNPSNGMPAPDASKKMDILEDLICSMLSESGSGIDVYVKTGKGMREFAFYVRNIEEFSKLLNLKLASKEKFPIEIAFYQDSQWQEFYSMRAAVK